MSINGATMNTPSKVLFGAGVYFNGVSYDEKVAPTMEAVQDAVIGATQEGGTLTITPETYDIQADGVNVPVEGLTVKVGETAEMEVSFLELTADYMAHAVFGNTVDSTDKNYDVVTSSDGIGAGHYYNGFGYYGELLDGRPVIIIFKKALCTSGFTTDAKSKQNSVFKGTFSCRGDLENYTKKLPYAIFIRKADGWNAANVKDVA